ncbi:MAG: amino acid ABC transporter permease/ATP-binding protein [Pseudomonadota bacterium]
MNATYLAQATHFLPEPVQELFSFATSDFLLQGALTALEIAALAMIGGITLGLIVALMRLSRFTLVRHTASFYIWFMRGTPIILQIVFLYDALPAIGIKFNSFTTAVLGFMLNEAAFSAEIIRGGILSVDRKQSVAAASLGMSSFMTLRRIILPQSIRVILPGITNQAINMVKGTSIASVIFVNELTFRSQQIVGQNFKFFTVFAAAGIIYLTMTSGISFALGSLEKYFNIEREKKPSRSTGFMRLFNRKGRPELEHSPAFLPPLSPSLSPPVSPANTTSLDITKKIQQLTKIDASKDSSHKPFVEFRNVQKAYGQRKILRGIDLNVYRGEVVVLMGPSGSGKSTLLRHINHLEQLDHGEIKVNDKYVGYEKVGNKLLPMRNLAKARAEARIGIVFQHFNLFDHLTALENIIESPIQVYGETPKIAHKIARELLEAVGLSRHADHLPHRLSGGQQQRVAIARALAISPNLMLFDEPTSALDPELVGEVLAVIRRLAKSGMTMIIATHEVRFAREVADRIVFMDEGKIIETGSPSTVLDKPQHERTQRFFSRIEAY